LVLGKLPSTEHMQTRIGSNIIEINQESSFVDEYVQQFTWENACLG